MFLELQTREQSNRYRVLLSKVASLSRLFSDANEPFIYYRAVENIFCNSFQARNISRSDVSADAVKDGRGFAIKTFLRKGRVDSLEKIAEFNNDESSFRNLNTQQKIERISQLRNERLQFTIRKYALNDMIYHCVKRDRGRILIYEEPVFEINMDEINIQEESQKRIKFSDSTQEYSFNNSKSTLYKRFHEQNVLMNFNVSILQDPIALIENIVHDNNLTISGIREEPHVFLPLYSTTSEQKYVPEKSGLNQWNAAGRPRKYNEIYIPIPIWIHRKFPRFFPNRDCEFNLTLPNENILRAKVCQDNGKALMSNPNTALGEWLLRDILSIEEGVLLTYDRLRELGVDSVVIYKHGRRDFSIDFTIVGSYDNFYNDYRNT
jgi:hypothetical protein